MALSILSTAFMNIRASLEHILPAQPCLLCGALSHDGICCAACRAELPRLSSAHCPTCALPTLAGETCGKCLRHPPHFDHTIAAFSYSFPISQLVKALKFREQLLLVNFLADELVTRIAVTPDMIVAMPLHPTRMRSRGYNQSQLLAERIASRMKVMLGSDVCHRVRDTPPQSSLPLKERDKNMRQAFSVSHPETIRGKHIAIVDDVMTSSASMEELAKILKKAGAVTVTACVVARTMPHNHDS